MFEYPLSDNSIPSSSSVSRTYVNLVNCFKISNLIILSHPLQEVSEPGECLNSPRLIIPPHHFPPFCVQPVRQLNLVNCLKTSHLIILSHPLLSSVIRYVNFVNCFRMSNLIILSHPLQGVRQLGQLFLRCLI